MDRDNSFPCSDAEVKTLKERYDLKTITFSLKRDDGQEAWGNGKLSIYPQFNRQTGEPLGSALVEIFDVRPQVQDAQGRVYSVFHSLPREALDMMRPDPSGRFDFILDSLPPSEPTES